MLRQVAFAAVLSFASVAAQGALLGRAPATPGGTDYQAYYDTTLKITWLADANLAASSTFGVAGICLDPVPAPGSGCSSPPGAMTWATAEEWLGAMNAANYLGVNNWRAPNADVNGNGAILTCRFSPAATCKDNELSYQYWVNQINSGTPSPFTNIATNVGFGYYYSSTEKPGDPGSLWIQNMGVQLEGYTGKTDPAYVWAVSSGDLLAVPVPAAAWLFGGALGLLGVARRRMA